MLLTNSKMAHFFRVHATLLELDFHPFHKQPSTLMDLGPFDLSKANWSARNELRMFVGLLTKTVALAGQCFTSTWSELAYDDKMRRPPVHDGLLSSRRSKAPLFE